MTQENQIKETLKAKLHVATGQFSFIEVELEGSPEEIVVRNDKLLKHYAPKQV